MTNFGIFFKAQWSLKYMYELFFCFCITPCVGWAYRDGKLNKMLSVANKESFFRFQDQREVWV